MESIREPTKMYDKEVQEKHKNNIEPKAVHILNHKQRKQLNNRMH